MPAQRVPSSNALEWTIVPRKSLRRGYCPLPPRRLKIRETLTRAA